MQANASKFQYILFRADDKLLDSNVLHIQYGVDLKSERCVKLLGADVDQSLSFKDHISRTCKKACRQLNVPSRLLNSLTVEAKVALVRSFIFNILNFAPLYATCIVYQILKNGKDPGKSFTFCIL